jgi:selenocysteine lyase/cysteine desulfurase
MDIDKIREGIKAFESGIFVNSAGSSIPPLPVNQAISSYLNREEEIGGYAMQFEAEEILSEFHQEVATLIHCESSSIAFASSATDAYGKALSSIPFEAGDTILTSDDDYVSNYFQFINLRDRYGARILRMPLLENGDLDLIGIQNQIERENPKIVALAHIPTNSGLVQDAAAVGQLCAEAEVIYLVDACQSVGQMEVSVKELQCDFLSVTGRKFMRGPRGTGFLYVSPRMLDAGTRPITMDGGGAVWTNALEYTLEASAKRYELWEKSYALLDGLKEAVRFANKLGMPEIEKYNARLMSHLRGNIKHLPHVKMLDRGSRLCNILTFRKDGVGKEHTQEHLKKHKVSCGIGVRGHAVIDYDKKGIDWLVRLSPHYFNTMEEMDELTKIIDAL